MSNGKIIYDITPFTHLDFPGKLAAIVWLIGCNMRCVYCYNPDIVFAQEGRYEKEDLLSFLDRRIGLLDGVVLSGGEPTRHDLVPLCLAIKERGFAIKLDTNGLRPDRIAELLAKKLIDYVALDFKAPHEKFGFITGSAHFDRFIETLRSLHASQIPFEVRTTVHADLLSVDDLERMSRWLQEHGYEGTYYLQPFVETAINMTNLEAPRQEMSKGTIRSPLPILWR